MIRQYGKWFTMRGEEWSKKMSWLSETFSMMTIVRLLCCSIILSSTSWKSFYTTTLHSLEKRGLCLMKCSSLVKCFKICHIWNSCIKWNTKIKFTWVISIRGHGKFSVRGRGPKNFWGDVGGDPNVRSTIRQRNFFLFCFQISKNRE